MDQNVQSSGVDAIVAPGSGVDLRLEKREIEALHVALAAGVTERFEIAPVDPLVLVRQIFGEILAAASAATGRQSHFRPSGQMDGWMDRRTNSRAISRAEIATGYLSSLLLSSPLPSAPAVVLNERRDARAWRCSQLFSRRCISRAASISRAGWVPLGRVKRPPRVHHRLLLRLLPHLEPHLFISR